jgi:hypothetical protein
MFLLVLGCSVRTQKKEEEKKKEAKQVHSSSPVHPTWNSLPSIEQSTPWFELEGSIQNNFHVWLAKTKCLVSEKKNKKKHQFILWKCIAFKSKMAAFCILCVFRSMKLWRGQQGVPDSVSIHATILSSQPGTIASSFVNCQHTEKGHTK